MPRPTDRRPRREPVCLALALVAGAATGSVALRTASAAAATASPGAAPAAFAAPQDARAAETLRRHLDAGAGLLGRGEPGLALPEYRAALGLAGPASDEAATARYGAGLCLIRLARPREAADVLAPVLDAPAGRPWRAASLLLLGSARRATGDAAGGLAALEAAVVEAGAAGDQPILEAARVAAVDAAWEAGAWDRIEELAAAALPAAGAAAPRLTWLAAAAAERRGDLAGAARLAAAVIASAERGGGGDPAIVRPARLLLGSCLDRLGRTEEAGRAYAGLAPRRAADADAVTVEAMAALASIDAGAGRPDAVVRRLAPLDAAFAKHPRDAQRTRLLARAHLELGRSDEAIAVIDVGLDRHGDADGQLAWLRGRGLLATGRPADAARWFGRSLESAPTGPAARAAAYDRIVSLSAAERPGDAADAAAAFLSRHASDALAAPARRLLASACLDAGRPAEAVAACRAFRAAHANHPLTVEIDLLAAEASEATGDLDAAADAWGGFIAGHPADPRLGAARARLGLVLHAAGRDAEAADVLAAATEAGAATPAVHRARGDVALRAGDWSGAADALAAALASPDGADRDDWRTRARYAHAARRAGRLDAAIAACDTILAREGSAPATGRARAHLERGLAHAANDDAEAAEADLVRAAAVAADTRPNPDAEAADDRAERRSIRETAIGRLAAMAAADGRHALAATRYAELELLAGDGAGRRDAAFRAAVASAAAGDHAAAAARFDDLAAAAPDPVRRADCLARAALARCRAMPLDPAAPRPAGADPVPVSAPQRLVLASIERALAEPEAPDDLRRSLAFEQLRRLRAFDSPEAALAAGERFLHEHAGSVEADHARLEVADLLMAAGRPADAARRLAPLVPAVAGRSIGGIVVESGDPAGARAPARVPRDLQIAAAWRLALACRETGDHAAAAAALEPVLAGSDDPALRRAAFAVAGEACLAAGRPGDAAAHFTALAADDADPEARDAATLRLAECRMTQRRWAAAERQFDAYLQRHPDSERWFAAAFGRGQAREQQGRADAAMDDYRRVATRHDGPTAARAQFQLGECLFAAGRHEDALRELMKVDILFDVPEWTAAALHETASCLERLGRPDEARTTLERLAREHAGTEWAARAARRLAAAAGVAPTRVAAPTASEGASR